MSNVLARLPQPQDHPLLRRRNPISTVIVVVPDKLNLLHLQNSSTTTSTFSDDLELLSIKPNSNGYTSLKDLLPSVAVNSPKPNSAPAQLGPDICIRNRLVKQAAWAYLQPMSASPGSAGGNFLNRLWPRVAAFFDFVSLKVIRAVDRTLRVIRIRGSI